MTRIFLSSLIVFLAISLKPVVVHADDDENASSGNEAVSTDSGGGAETPVAVQNEDRDEGNIPPPSEWEKSKDAREKAANSYMDEEMSRKSYYDPVPQPEMHGDINTPTNVSDDGSSETARPVRHHAKHKAIAKRLPQKKHARVASSKKSGKRKTAKNHSRHRYANN